jgi:hypothetical protein
MWGAKAAMAYKSELRTVVAYRSELVVQAECMSVKEYFLRCHL